MFAGSMFVSLVLLAAPTEAPARCIQVIGTNDVHGHLLSEKRRVNGLEVEQGGLAAMGGYLATLRERYPGQLLLVDGGDLFQGTVPSNFSKGAAVIAAYNALGYDGAAVGNHEFDFGPEAGEADVLGALRKRMEESSFPFLSCNVFVKATGKRPDWKNFAPSKLLTIGGIKVGLIGASTPETPLVTIPAHVASLEFREPAPLVKAEAQRLRKQGAQLIVLTTHIGGDCRDNEHFEELGSCKDDSELFRLARALPKGLVDVIVAGHTHKYVAHHVNGIAVSEAGFDAKSFGWIEACVGPKGAVTTRLHTPQDLCLSTWDEGGCGPRDFSSGVVPATFLDRPVHACAKVKAVVEPFIERVRAAQEQPIGVELQGPLVRARDRLSRLGFLVAEGIRQAIPGAQIGLTNAGGVRADLAPGTVRYGQVFQVLPFDNRVVGLRLTGEQLESFILAPLSSGHGFPQLAGATLELVEGKPHLTLADGAAIDPKREYLLATNDFLANGGDGAKPVINSLAPDHRENTPTLVRDAFIAHLKRLEQPVKSGP